MRRVCCAGTAEGRQRALAGLRSQLEAQARASALQVQQVHALSLEHVEAEFSEEGALGLSLASSSPADPAVVNAITPGGAHGAAFLPPRPQQN